MLQMVLVFLFVNNLLELIPASMVGVGNVERKKRKVCYD